MAHKPSGSPLPADWRQTLNYRVGLMLARVPQEQYETEARAFERFARGRLSDDWRAEWKAWRFAKLARPQPEIFAGMFGD